MHRREEEWGTAGAAWMPERWEGRKFGPEYAPFSAGRRVCIGEQLSMTELSYVTARVLQRFDRIMSPPGQDNLTKGYKVLVQPKNGVKTKLRTTGGKAPRRYTAA
ncbi:hypothetical protein LTR56_026371 [Elasticomyces elasticus]|nr:hypothetical protein LTR56_026371 [Elasticomyces elasticus]KAK3625762.1 hypothetical protein LTR22_023416 [Elasticomyces elasticus]KAK4903662.1 hypothetical protein LTR49_026734 [Elasticomyces elasticus]KAK5746534.1 hypothetical protein LTS12_022717 [Elasticomyces elasticus]